jgi:hypothetical protein
MSTSNLVWHMGAITIGIGVGLFGSQWLIDKWRAGKPERDKRNYQRGLDWALSELNNGANPGDLYDKCDSTFGNSAFDRGANAALFQWELDGAEAENHQMVARYAEAAAKLKNRLNK